LEKAKSVAVSIEIEVKFQIASWEEGERLLSEAGATLSRPRYFERNSLLDSPEQVLQKRGAALRLRQARGRSWLTYKGPELGSGRFKERQEYETVLEDASAIEEIFRSLGFVERFQYEKYRAVYTIGQIEACLDEAPMGFYLELEGEREGIESVVRKVGFRMADTITAAYPQLYQAYRDQTPQAPEFMVFSKQKRPR
jgi:adenylate cyclase class 2